MNVELHIEALVLRGLGGGMQHEIQAAMERELAELLRAKGVGSLSRLREFSQVDVGSFSLKSSDNPQTLGVQLAQSVYRGIV
jgi:hypothetical protein